MGNVGWAGNFGGNVRAQPRDDHPLPGPADQGDSGTNRVTAPSSQKTGRGCWTLWSRIELQTCFMGPRTGIVPLYERPVREGQTSRDKGCKQSTLIIALAVFTLLA
jgi:hypothetical protein